MNEVKLPDFDDMISITTEIGTLKRSIALDKTRLERLQAYITEMATKDETYFVSDKPPSMAFIKANYHVLGLTTDQGKELETLGMRLAENEGRLRELELLFDVYRAMIDVWRTESANMRGSFFEGS